MDHIQSVFKNKKRNALIGAAVLALILFLLLKPFSLLLDSILLVDNSARLFDTLNVDTDYTDLYIPVNQEEIPVASNCLCLDISEQWVNGVGFIPNEDGSVTIGGANVGGDFDVFLGYITGPFGEYILSDGADDPDFGFLYVYSSSAKADASVTALTDRFVINDETDVHSLFFHFYEGKTADTLTIYPMARPSAVSDDSFVAPAVTAYHTFDPKSDDNEDPRVLIKKFSMSRADYDSLSFFDRLYLNNYIQHVASLNQYAWVTIDFGDGTGIQFPGCNPKKQVHGSVDAWGRVI